MTETSEDGNYLVRVRAQVMTRDDSSGGWVPLSGGGLANVSVRRRPVTSIGHQQNATNGTNISSATVTPAPSNEGSTSTSPPSLPKRRHEYLIYGKRITDQSVVLSCTIKKDFEYNKVMPTFHHWRTGEKKFGLTFQTAADARAFDKGVRTAVEELLEGLVETTLVDGHVQSDGGDDDVFMTLNLPVEPPDPRQATETTYGGYRMPPYHSQSTDVPDPHRPIHFIGGPSVATDNYPYVQLTALNNEYLYPVIDEHKADRLDRRNSGGSLKKHDISMSQPIKNTGKRNLRMRCKHCQELYSEQHNSRGSCEYAPDSIRRGIAAVSCLTCAQCMLYHCMSDAEGDFAQNPCSCSSEEGCGRRWLGLALLSLIVPCLWFYPPLRAVHWCGMSCGLCGGRHHPME